jgi:Pentapeptide repeats (8 copies)
VLLRQVPWRTVLGWFGLLVAAAAVVVAGVYVVFWPVSDLIARHDVGAITGLHRAAALQAARDAARGRLLTFGAGLFAAGALVYTARNFTLSRRTFDLTEQGQVTDRYTKAIEQLGSDKLDVRIGGVYALERVARDSPRDHPTVMEVLAAFVREHSREQWPPSADEPGVDAPEHMTRPDVQAAITVIGRRNLRHDRQPVNLSDANLSAAALSGAVLSHALLHRANLTGADLTDADLTGANLLDADLTHAYVQEANLTDTFMLRANLTEAALFGANLTRASLSETNLSGAFLQGANLSGATFYDSNLTGATWPAYEPVPTGWQRDADSGRLKRAGTDSRGAGAD